MKKAGLLLALLALSVCSTFHHTNAAKPGQTARQFSIERRQVLSANYLLFLPEGYGTDPAKRWPLILFLHGGGESGTNVWLVAKHGPPKIVAQQTNFPFIVVSPQCPNGQIWSDDLLLALLHQIESQYAVDRHRVYLTGLSLGGFGTWSLGLSHPELFAAIAPICGGGDFITPHVANESNLVTLAVWAFHGAKDPVVPLAESQRMVDILKQIGVHEVKLTVFPDAGHECWPAVYAGPELYAWFLRHER